MKNFYTVNKTEILNVCRSLKAGKDCQPIIGNCSVGSKTLVGVKIAYESKTYYLRAYCISKQTYLAVRGFSNAKELADFVRSNQR